MAGCVVVILIGLHTVGVLHLRWLDVDTRVDFGGFRPKSQHATSALWGGHFYSWLATVHWHKSRRNPDPQFYAGDQPVNAGVVPRFEESGVLDRCLLHVASTRARDTLTITSFGRPSRFLG